MSVTQYRRLRTVPEVARELSVCRQSVYRWIDRGELRAVRFGESGSYRIPDDALEQFLRPTDAPTREDNP